MLHTFANTEHRHKSWGGPPGPRPTPSSARSRWAEIVFIGAERVATERVQGDPRGPGGPPHKSMWHWAGLPAPQRSNAFIPHAVRRADPATQPGAPAADWLLVPRSRRLWQR